MHEKQEDFPATNDSNASESLPDVASVAENGSSGPDKVRLPLGQSSQPGQVNGGTEKKKPQEHEDGVGSGAPAVKASIVPKNQSESQDAPEHASGSVVDDNRSSIEGSNISKYPDGILDNPAAHARISSLGRKDLLDGTSQPKGVSEWSHQQLAPRNTVVEEKGEVDEWQDMPAFAAYDVYDDDGKLVAREAQDSDGEGDAYRGLGGAGKGYTRVQIDEDARSATSMDENTSYLFKETGTNVVDEDEEHRDPLAQMQATKDLLTEGQRIAYVGVTRLAMVRMVKELEYIEGTKGTKKELRVAVESMKMWSQKMMVRLYAHMDIDSAGTYTLTDSWREKLTTGKEQVMIEQLAEHGVEAGDLTPTLMQNSRVKNPLAEGSSSAHASVTSPRPDADEERSISSAPLSPASERNRTPPPPPYEEHEGKDLPEVRTPTQLPMTKNIDIDLRWTVLCDLFLVLIADSIYDSRSRVLLERVGASMEVSWLEICRFEKRVTDALEMQEAADKENWNEAEHMENRRKLALKRKYMMMGLATVGGSLVIGLSAGLLAPVIGAGLAAGFTTIGVAGTSGFLAGAGGTALITSGAVVTGGTIAVRASHRRTGAVQTFEYRPLHNNKRVNLIVTISGWMNGKIDDVRLPYSTVDPIMGDMYSVLWEPEMLQSMGDTINILATEVTIPGRASFGHEADKVLGSYARAATSTWKYNSGCSHGIFATAHCFDKACIPN